MRLTIYVFLSFALSSLVSAQQFTDFVLHVQNAPQQRQQYLVDSFLTHVSSFPLVESDSLVHVLYKGEAEKVFFSGDGNAWSDEHSPLSRLAETDLWYRSEKFEPDARIDYKLVVDQNWILDPNNPLTAPGGFGPSSELRMPSYEPPEEIQVNASHPHGSVVDTVFFSAVLNNSRTASIYLPPGYHQSHHRYPLALFHDGNEFLSLAHATTVIDNLIAQKRIPPIIAVFLPAVNRNEEYAGTQMANFGAFVIDEVLAAVDKSYRTIKDADARAVVGTSNGGHIALYMGMQYPNSFGNVGAQSSNVTPLIAQGYGMAAAIPVRLYMDLGTYDLEILIPRVQSFLSVLQQGYDYLFQEFHEGHSWGSWRARIDDMLEYFFSDLVRAAPPPAVPADGVRLSAPLPNPARTHATIQATFSQAIAAQLRLFDSSGRLLRQLWNGRCEPGTQQFNIDVNTLHPGWYLLSLDTPSGRTTQRLLVL